MFSLFFILLLYLQCRKITCKPKFIEQTRDYVCVEWTHIKIQRLWWHELARIIFWSSSIQNNQSNVKEISDSIVFLYLRILEHLIADEIESSCLPCIYCKDKINISINTMLKFWLSTFQMNYVLWHYITFMILINVI